MQTYNELVIISSGKPTVYLSISYNEIGIEITSIKILISMS